MNRTSVWLCKAAVLVPAIILAVVASVPGVVATSTPGWRTDLDAARREAAAAGKDVLVEFTVRGAYAAAPEVDQRVYDTSAFLKVVDKHFVPVRLIARTDGSALDGDADVITLSERFGVSKVPSLVLMDSAGKPYAAVESDSNSTESQLALVERGAAARVRRDAAFARAAAAGGVERAKYLHEAMQQVDRFVGSAYESTAAEIVALDPGDSLGVSSEYSAVGARRRIDRRVQAVVYPSIDRGDLPGAAKAIDDILVAERPPVALAQTLMAFKGQLLYSMGKQTEARRLLGEALALAPLSESADAVKNALRQMEE